VSEFLQVNDRARDELERIGSLEFNIFQLQAETGQNELVTAVSSILAREDIFSVLDIPFETFMRFIGKIQ
jgi:ribonuclease HIII